MYIIRKVKHSPPVQPYDHNRRMLGIKNLFEKKDSYGILNNPDTSNFSSGGFLWIITKQQKSKCRKLIHWGRGKRGLYFCFLYFWF